MLRGQYPLRFYQEELLGRALFSGHFKNGKILAGAFIVKDPSKGISVNRLKFAPRCQMDFLSKANAQRRTANFRKKNSNAPETNFYGYASIKTKEVSCIRLDKGKTLGLKVTPKFGNPFHADITLPVGESKDFYLKIADELLKKAKFQEPLKQ